jgi:hypothetical protein
VTVRSVSVSSVSYYDITMKFIGTAVAALCVSGLTALAQDAKPRAVIELFTSQGCSSCPPADRLMGEFVKDPTLIVLSLPVDYWDYLGWKDTLAHASFTYRQRAYSAMRGDRQVYTPQVVVNGLVHAVGSDRGQIEKTFAATQGQALSSVITIVRRDTGLQVECPARAADAGPAHLWALPFISERSVQIGRGENGGRSVTYVNVVRSVTRIGECKGSAAAVEIPAGLLLPDANGVVVLMQAGSEKKPAQILAAARRMVP